MDQPLPLDETVTPNGKPESCKLCTLYNSTEGIVWGEGHTSAKMMFVGEAPGEEEGREKRPFTGGSGRVFNALLQHAGILRREVFVTNTVKCRPTATSNGKVINRAPSDHEIHCCARFLLEEIRKVNPNVVVALGNVPMRTITDAKKGITIVRSVPTEGCKRLDGKADRYKVIGTLHPAAVMRQQDYWPAVVFDMVRARNESASPVISRRVWKNIIHANLKTHGEYLERAIRLYRRYYHDLETTGLDWRKDSIRCIGVAAQSSEVFVFDWTDDVIAFIRKIHADPTLLTVGQNSEGFDIPFQEGKGFEFHGPTWDTLLGFHLLNSGLPKSLDFIGACVTDELYWKDDTMYRSGEDGLQTGCGKDIHATGRAYEEQVRELEMKGLLDLMTKHIMPLQPILRNMHKRGVKKDLRTAAIWHIRLNQKADEIEERLKKGLGDPTFDVNSPKQLMDLLYTRMHLPVQYNEGRNGFRPTVDADALDALSNDPRVPKQLQPILLLVRSIRTCRKMDSTYIQCDMDKDWFIHGHFSTAKAQNGRLNSFNPNMQNFPLDMRDIVIPDTKDHVLVARDWSQIEWRIAMALAGDKVGLDALAAGRDSHQDAYANAHNVEYESVTKAMRFEAKTYNYGLLYGRGAESLAAGRAGHPESAIPVERVQDYINKFFGKYQAYKLFRDQIEKDVATKNCVTTAWGRPRYWYTKSRMPEAFNFPISGSAASMMYEALMELEAQLPKGAELRLTVHDEVVINCVKEQKVLQQTLECSRDVMERPFHQITERSLYPEIVKHYYPNGWYCESDCHIGENWRITKGENEHDLSIEMELRKKLGVRDLEMESKLEKKLAAKKSIIVP